MDISEAKSIHRREHRRVLAEWNRLERIGPPLVKSRRGWFRAALKMQREAQCLVNLFEAQHGQGGKDLRAEFVYLEPRPFGDDRPWQLCYTRINAREMDTHCWSSNIFLSAHACDRLVQWNWKQTPSLAKSLCSLAPGLLALLHDPDIAIASNGKIYSATSTGGCLVLREDTRAPGNFIGITVLRAADLTSFQRLNLVG